MVVFSQQLINNISSLVYRVVQFVHSLICILEYKIRIILKPVQWWDR